MQIDFVKLKTGYENNEIQNYKACLEAENISEWPLINHALASAVFQIIDHIECLLKLNTEGSVSVEAQKYSSDEINRNIYFARSLIHEKSKWCKENSLEVDAKLSEFKKVIDDLDIIFDTALSNDAEYQNQQLSLSNNRRSSYSLISETVEPSIYGKDPSGKECEFDFQDPEFNADLCLATSSLLNSLSLYTEVLPVTRLFFGGYVGEDDSPHLVQILNEFFAASMQDNGALVLSKTDSRLTLNKNSDTKQFRMISGFDSINEQLGAFLGSYLENNLSTKIQIENFLSENGMTRAQFEYLWEIISEKLIENEFQPHPELKKSPTEE